MLFHYALDILVIAEVDEILITFYGMHVRVFYSLVNCSYHVWWIFQWWFEVNTFAVYLSHF